MKETIESIEASRIDSARHLAEEERVTVILKGARTVVATPKGDIFINTTGNPYMASGGMGDALTGMIAALASQGLSPNDAACAGVFLHGMSADLLVRDHPMTPVTATDVIDNIRGALQQTLGEPRRKSSAMRRFRCVASEGGAPFVARRAMNLHGCAPASGAPFPQIPAFEARCSAPSSFPSLAVPQWIRLGRAPRRRRRIDPLGARPLREREPWRPASLCPPFSY